MPDWHGGGCEPSFNYPCKVTAAASRISAGPCHSRRRRSKFFSPPTTLLSAPKKKGENAAVSGRINGKREQSEHNYSVVFFFVFFAFFSVMWRWLWAGPPEEKKLLSLHIKSPVTPLEKRPRTFLLYVSCLINGEV